MAHTITITIFPGYYINWDFPSNVQASVWRVPTRKLRPIGYGKPIRRLKKASEVDGVVMFEDEASFWLDGTIDQTWSRIGKPPQVDTYGQRKTAHLFGAVSVDEARFSYHFAPVFNGHTFHEFLLILVALHAPRKIFLIIDNGPCHWLDDEGKK